MYFFNYIAKIIICIVYKKYINIINKIYYI